MRLAGAAMGARAGPLGALTGYSLGGGVARSVGLGSYTPLGGRVVTNQIHGASRSLPMRINSASGREGDIVFSHTEFIGNVKASGTANGQTGFEVRAFELNPGLRHVFPFLSQLAQNFTLYQWLGLAFEYRPVMSDYGNANSNSLGKVIMTTNYDPTEGTFASSIEAENEGYATAAKPSMGQRHFVENSPKQLLNRMFFVRTGESKKDLLDTDIGTFQLCTEGISLGASTTSLIGELWVTYKVRLSRATLHSTVAGSNIPSSLHMSAKVCTAAADPVKNLAADANRLLSYDADIPYAYHSHMENALQAVPTVQFTGMISANELIAPGAVYLPFARDKDSNVDIVVVSRKVADDSNRIYVIFPSSISTGRYRITAHTWQNKGDQEVTDTVWDFSPGKVDFMNCVPVQASCYQPAEALISGGNVYTQRSTKGNKTQQMDEEDDIEFMIDVNAGGVSRAIAAFTYKIGSVAIAQVPKVFLHWVRVEQVNRDVFNMTPG